MRYGKLFVLAIAVCSLLPINAQKKYTNPVYNSDYPDPSVQRAQDGYFYSYATGCRGRKSKDLVSWTNLSNVISRPTWNDSTYVDENGNKKTDYYSFWACDVNYVDNKYLMYYACALWGNGTRTGIGVATGDRPDKFTDKGRLFRSTEIGVHNSIDPCYIEEGDKKYLVWGSFHDIYISELTDDGLQIKNFKKKTKIAGGAFEGVMIHKRENYYYMFASVGSCCEGVNSTYRTVVGRAKKLTGPYVNKQGGTMFDNNYTTIIKGNDRWKGTGHNSEIITDDAGQDWLLYHAYDAKDDSKGRVMLLDKINWTRDGWPEVNDGTPTTTEQDAPIFYDGDGKNVTYKLANADLHRSGWHGWNLTASEDADIASGSGTVFMPFGYAKSAGSFDVNQTVSGLEDGLYEFRSNHFAVGGGVELYMNELATPAYNPSADEGAANPPVSNNTISNYFMNDRYERGVYGLVQGGELTIGMRSIGNLTSENRFHIGDIQLIYREKNNAVMTEVIAGYRQVADKLISEGKMFYQGYKPTLEDYFLKTDSAADDSIQRYKHLENAYKTISSIRESMETYASLEEKINAMDQNIQNAVKENYVTEEAQTVLAEARQVLADGSLTDLEIKDLMKRMDSAIHNMEYAYQEGDGTAENPYIIRRPAQLDYMHEVLVNKQMVYFQLAADVDMAGYDWKQLNTSANLNRYWINFDGKGHVIKNLKPNGDKYYPSFFGTLCGECRNVGFVDAVVESETSGAAVLCGYMGHSTFKDEDGNMYPVIVENCYFTGSISAEGFVGSIGGTLHGSPIIIRNCYSAVNIAGQKEASDMAGGLVGRVRTSLTIENCYATGDICSYTAGGIVAGGQNSTTPASIYNNVIAWNKQVSGVKANAFGATEDEDQLQNVYVFADMTVNDVQVTDGKSHSELQSVAGTWTAPWHSDPAAGNGYPILQWQYERGDYTQICGFPLVDGISSPSTDGLQSGSNVYYDLSGRRVQKPVKGVYIINGKKVLF